MDTISEGALNNEILLAIFECVSIPQRKRLSRVCKKWKQLIDRTYQWVTTFSAVDDRRCVTNWQPSNWLSLQCVSKDNYIRIPGISATDILIKVIDHLPNLRAIDLECCDLNTRIFRTLLIKCPRIEKINLDSSTRLNYYTFRLMINEWKNLRHINVSCCTDVSEDSAHLIISSLIQLESLNLCGTRITGNCLRLLNKSMRRLDISYCWGVQEEGLLALARCDNDQLEELCVNTFDFDTADTCLIALTTKFKYLKHLQMSIGPCVAFEYFIDKITSRGFQSICKLINLESLIIEKICILDSPTVIQIFQQCTKLKRITLNLGWLNFCSDRAFVNLGTCLPMIEHLSLSYPASLTSAGLTSIANLERLTSLTLNNTDVNNDIFKYIENLNQLTMINFNDCRKINIKGLNHLCKIASRRSNDNIEASLLGTGIVVARITRAKKRFPPNLKAQVSNFRATKYHMQLPPVALSTSPSSS